MIAVAVSARRRDERGEAVEPVISGRVIMFAQMTKLMRDHVVDTVARRFDEMRI